MKKIQSIKNSLTKKSQRGFAIVSAIFLIVTLAALGAFMVTFSNTQHLTSAQDVQGSRAYWAARAGLEWGVGSIVATCPTSPTTFTVNTFSVVVTCAQQSYTEASATINIFKLTSVASTGTVGSLGFIERSVSASIEK
jgi:MSHA biogenesis protein MshP